MCSSFLDAYNVTPYAVSGSWSLVLEDHAAPHRATHCGNSNTSFCHSHWTPHDGRLCVSVVFACCTAPPHLTRIVQHAKVMNRSCICLLQVAVLSLWHVWAVLWRWISTICCSCRGYVALTSERVCIKNKLSTEDQFSLEAGVCGEDTSLHLCKVTSQRLEGVCRKKSATSAHIVLYAIIFFSWSVYGI